MRNLLFVIASLEPSGAAKQLALLAPGLPPEEFAAQICVLGNGGPFSRSFQAAGLPTHVLGWTRPLDLQGLLKLRRLVHDFDPDVIHVLGLSAFVRVCFAVGRGNRSLRARQLVLSGPVSARRQGILARRWTRLLLDRADHVAATGLADAARWRQLGVSPSRLRVVAPAVALPPASAAPAADIRRHLHLAPGAPLVVCAGPIEPHKGFRDALWAYDILSYLYPDLSLLVIGSGSERPKLERLTRLANLSHVIFLGPQAETGELIAQADVVWVPSLTASGVNVALEAMAAGKPVVASRLPHLAEIIADGQHGFLIPPGDKVALARQTRLLINDASRRRQLGNAAQEWVAKRFAVPALCRQVARLYESAAA